MSDGVDIVVTLHALATYAESANHWTDDKRMMDASGVADTIYEAMDRIEELEADLRKMALDVIAADGQSQEAYQAQLESEAKLAKAVTRLQHIAANKTTDELTVIEWDTHDTFTILDACISEARTTLAELKGEK